MSYEAWRNFPSQSLETFVRAQKMWAVGGLLLVSTLIGLNLYVWYGYNRADQNQNDGLQRESRLMKNYWGYQDASGRLIKYKFFSPITYTPDNCAIGPENGNFVLAHFDLTGFRLDISPSHNPTVGNQSYILSPDEQTLTERGSNPGAEPRVLHRLQQLAPQ